MNGEIVREGMAKETSASVHFSLDVEGLLAQDGAGAGVAVAQAVGLDAAEAAASFGLAILLEAGGALLLGGQVR